MWDRKGKEKHMCECSKEFHGKYKRGHECLRRADRIERSLETWRKAEQSLGLWSQEANRDKAMCAKREIKKYTRELKENKIKEETTIILNIYEISGKKEVTEPKRRGNKAFY